MMHVNLDGVFRNAIHCIQNDAVAFSISELEEHLQYVRKGWEEGRSEEVLNDFFALYVTPKPKQAEAA